MFLRAIGSRPHPLEEEEAVATEAMVGMKATWLAQAVPAAMTVTMVLMAMALMAMEGLMMRSVAAFRARRRAAKVLAEAVEEVAVVADNRAVAPRVLCSPVVRVCFRRQ